MRKPLQHLFKWLNIGVFLITCLAYIAPYFNPENIWLFTFFGSAYSWLLLANILFVIFWLFLKSKYCLISIICIAIGWSHFTTFVGINISPKPTSKNTIKIMSYNLAGLYKLSFKNKKQEQKERNAFFHFLNKKTKPAILCTQETAWPKLVSDDLIFPHRVRSDEVAIFSKYPFIKSGQLELNTSVNACAWADIQLPNKKIIRVYSVHLQSNRVSMDAERLRENGNLQEKETWNGITNMLRKYKRAAVRRANQANIIAQHAAKSPHPVVICGDFNDTPQSYTYRTLRAHRKDAYQEAAFGLGTTYSGSIPGLKIDHMLVDSSIQVNYHKIIKDVDYSDHFPIMSLIE